MHKYCERGANRLLCVAVALLHIAFLVRLNISCIERMHKMDLDVRVGSVLTNGASRLNTLCSMCGMSQISPMPLAVCLMYHQVQMHCLTSRDS